MPILKIRDSLIVKNTLWMLIGHGLRTILQAAYFILLARAVGAAGYGAFIGVSALVAILAPFASLGSGNILVKHVARDPSVFDKYWGNALLLTLVSGGMLLAALLVTSRFALPSSIAMLLIVTIGVADLLLTRLADISGQAYQAVQRLGRTAQPQPVGGRGRPDPRHAGTYAGAMGRVLSGQRGTEHGAVGLAGVPGAGAAPLGHRPDARGLRGGLLFFGGPLGGQHLQRHRQDHARAIVDAR
jgi:hypothetical protein